MVISKHLTDANNSFGGEAENLQMYQQILNQCERMVSREGRDKGERIYNQKGLTQRPRGWSTQENMQVVRSYGNGSLQNL